MLRLFRQFAVVMVALTLAGAAALATAQPASAGSSPAPVASGYPVFADPSVSVTCANGVPKSIKVSSTWDANSLHSIIANQLVTVYLNSSKTSIVKQVGTGNVTFTPATNGSFDSSYVLPATTGYDRIGFQISTADQYFVWTSESRGLNCSPPQTPGPPKPTFIVNCDGSVDLTFDTSSVSGSWTWIIVGDSHKSGFFVGNPEITRGSKPAMHFKAADIVDTGALVLQLSTSIDTLEGLGITAAFTNKTKPPNCTASTPPAYKCNNVLFIGVAGSNEPNEYGPEVDLIRQGFLGHLPQGLTHRELYVPYTAAAVPIIPTPGAVSNYFASINDGTAKLISILGQSQKYCKGPTAEKWVLAGYSQGALVINQVIRNFNLPDQVAQIDLVADPGRVPNQTGINTGDADPGYGIFKQTGVALGPIPSDLSGKVVSLCDAGDIVCDFTHYLSTGSLYDGVKTHTSYPKNEGPILLEMGIRAVGGAGYAATYAPISFNVQTGGVQGFQPGSSIGLNLQGYAPGQSVQLIFHSSRIDLGYRHADAKGRLETSIALPASLATGEHVLYLVSASGTARLAFKVAPLPTVVTTTKSTTLPSTKVAPLPTVVTTIQTTTPPSTTATARLTPSTTAPASTVALQPQLASTGNTVGDLPAFGLVAALAGALLVGVSRRRRSSGGAHQR